MQMIFLLLALFFCHPDLSIAESNHSTDVIHHDIKITLYPDSRRFSAEDTITLPDRTHNGPNMEISFELHQGLGPSIQTPEAHMSAQSSETSESGLPPLELYRIALPAGLRTFTLIYGGAIDRPEVPSAAGQAQNFSENPDMISENGVYLSGASCWYPRFDNEMITFTVSASHCPWVGMR